MRTRITSAIAAILLAVTASAGGGLASASSSKTVLTGTKWTVSILQTGSSTAGINYWNFDALRHQPLTMGLWSGIGPPACEKKCPLDYAVKGHEVTVSYVPTAAQAMNVDFSGSVNETVTRMSGTFTCTDDDCLGFTSGTWTAVPRHVS